MIHNACCIGSVRELSGQPSYIPHGHMILSKQKCYLLLTGFSTESKTYLCTSDRGFSLINANTSDKGPSFVDLNIKIIGSDVHTSIYGKRDDFGFPIVNFPWLSGDVPRLPSYGVYISQLVRFARCCTSASDFHSKTLQITSKLMTQGYIYHKLRKIFGKFYGSYYDIFLSKFG